MLASLPIILLDNGSKRPAAALALRETAVGLSSRLGREVFPASVAFSDGIPTELLDGAPAKLLGDLVLDLAERGEPSAIIAPLFLGPSGGLSKGLAAARAAAPAGFDLLVGECLVADAEQEDSGMPVDTRVARALATEVLRVARRKRLVAPLKVLVVDHGTPSKAVNAVRNRLAQQLDGLLGYGRHGALVGAASMERRDGAEYDFNEPLLERALTAAPYDTGDVVLAMAFVLPGRHAGEGGDVAQIAEAAQAAAEASGQQLRVHTTPLLGRSPFVLDVLADRVHDADRPET